MEKVIFHLDNDSYFASAHATVDPSIKGKPAVVSTNAKRSIVTAASYEAKALGIHVPMPVYKAKEIYPDVIILKPNYNLYTVLSTKLFEFISSTYTKNIEVASVDECFIDVTDVWKKYGSPVKLAKHMQQNIMKTFSLPVSIGISNNKFVAKMSTSINKPLGITVTKPGNFLEVFGDWPLEKYWGIGAPTAEKLHKLKITTIGELAMADRDSVKEVLGKVTDKLIDQANGNGDDVVDTSLNELKGISNSITFMNQDRSSRQEILVVLKDLCAKVSHRMKNRNFVGYVVTVGLKEALRGKTKAKTHQRTLKVPICELEDIFKEATSLFDELWNEESVKFLSVGMSKVENMFETTYQDDIFTETKQKSKIENIIDNVNRKFKKHILTTGAEGKRNQVKKQNQSRYLENDRIIKHYDK